jgi:hypothetical protein
MWGKFSFPLPPTPNGRYFGHEMLKPVPVAYRGSTRNLLQSPRGLVDTPLPSSPSPKRVVRYSSTVVSTTAVEVRPRPLIDV